MNNPIRPYEEYRTAFHGVGDHTLAVQAVDAETGEPVIFDGIRQAEIEGVESYIGRLTMWDKERQELLVEEVALPEKLDIREVNTLHRTARDKGKIILAGGTIALTLAIGTGLVVKRLRSKH